MKIIKFYISLLLFAFPVLIYAQDAKVWIGLGLKAGYGTGYLLNQSAFFQDNNVGWDIFSPAYSYGGRLAFAFGPNANLSVSFEGLNGKVSQNFSINDGNNVQNYQALLNFWQIGMIFKAAAPTGGFYVELGPQLNYVRSATVNQTDLLVHTGNFTSAVFGLGLMPYIGDFVEVSLGLRATASLGSVFADGYDVYSSSPNASTYTTNSNIAVSFMPVIDINFLIAYMGRASCGAFRIMPNTGSNTRKVKIRR